MSQEIVRIIEVADGGVWVEAVQRSACGSCNARSGCGQHSLSKLGRPMRLWVPGGEGLKAGQDVVLEMPSGSLALSALLLYGLPLLGLIVGATLGQKGGDLMSGLGAVAGLSAGFLSAKVMSGHFRSRWTPKLLPGCQQIPVVSAE
ncbi:SoxR reducing system RseC family protein [Thalassolituus sp. LLYu03]|uniref:SoxR reducing system RseC family protein n=1 Tax=Thalassolituus sp. LLYu03 TaxID=3421656 RepID=UPI003D2C81DE